MAQRCGEMVYPTHIPSVWGTLDEENTAPVKKKMKREKKSEQKCSNNLHQQFEILK